MDDLDFAPRGLGAREGDLIRGSLDLEQSESDDDEQENVVRVTKAEKGGRGNSNIYSLVVA